MTNPSFLGYLTNPYLEDPYSGDTGLYALGMGVDRQIVDLPRPVGAEVNRQIIDFTKVSGAEALRQIESSLVSGSEVFRVVIIGQSVASQTGREIVDLAIAFGSQTELTIQGAYVSGSEVFRTIAGLPAPTGMEVNRQILDMPQPVGMEIRRDKSLASWLCESQGYLEQGYLDTPYLTAGICAQMGMEVHRIIVTSVPVGSEVLRIIDTVDAMGSEVLRQIADFPVPTGMEVDRLGGVTSGMQTRLVLYNTKLLRVLIDFPSRGTSGINWSSTSTASGDFDVNNLNTDIVEQVWRSSGATSAVLVCDTEVTQGIPIDTLAILNHNLTRSATITVEGSPNSAFSIIQQTFTVEMTTTNAYYIAENFPTTQSRYWRFIINDTTNPSGYLQIGTIVFGTSIIFQGESFVDTVTRRNIHFADKVATEGFTNVSNDRALKRAVALEFRHIDYGKGNYKSISNVFDSARTSLKCLWIPDPQDPPRFSVFGKLSSIPEEAHRNMGPGAADTVDFSLEVDESL